MYKKALLLGSMFAGMTSFASAAPVAAPDTADIISTIANFGGAAIALWTAYIIYPIAVKVLNRLFSR